MLKRWCRTGEESLVSLPFLSSLPTIKNKEGFMFYDKKTLECLEGIEKKLNSILVVLKSMRVKSASEKGEK